MSSSCEVPKANSPAGDQNQEQASTTAESQDMRMDADSTTLSGSQIETQGRPVEQQMSENYPTVDVDLVKSPQHKQDAQGNADASKVNELTETNEDKVDSIEEVDMQDSDKSKEALFAMDENSAEEPEGKPIEEVDAEGKEDSNDGAPDLGAADPLMKDTDNQVEDGEHEHEHDEESEQMEPLEKTDVDADKVTLSVKPPGDLMEGNFVDVADEDSPAEETAMDTDPIETTEQDEKLLEDQEQEPEEPAGEPLPDDLFNCRDTEAETILAEDDTDVSDAARETAAAQSTAETPGDADKFIITLANKADKSACTICSNEEVPEYLAHKNERSESVCAAACLEKFKEKHAGDYIERILRLRVFTTEETVSHEEMEPTPCLLEDEMEEGRDPLRQCKHCHKSVDADDYVTWEARDFCNEGCLRLSQASINADCAKCQQPVPDHLLGKYCVRFGTTVTQFCKTSCLISYKKARKLCQYCQEDLRDEAADVFCSKRCRESANPESSDPKQSAPCSVCRQEKEVELVVRGDDKTESICSERCFVAYKFVNKIEMVKCVVCPMTFRRKPGDHSVYEMEQVHCLCSRECQKIFLIIHRNIVNCGMCLVKKYDFDMIRHVEGATLTCVCSLSCLTVYFESTYSQKVKMCEPNVAHLEQIANGQNYTYQGRDLAAMIDAACNIGKAAVQMLVVTKPRHIPRQKNKAVSCAPRMLTKAIQHKIKERSVEVQTDDTTTRWIPIPAPVYVPTPLSMYVQPIPMLTPVPIPLLIPIFIRTGRRSMKGIQKEIAKIKNRIPADPLEAEILMMADMAAGDKRNEPTSDSDDDVAVPDSAKILDTSMSQMDAASSSAFPDDVLSMAFKMANEYTEPLDLESEVDNSTRMLAAGRRPRLYAPRGRSSTQRVMDMAKPDENLSLKYTFGVNAWKQWATIKNLELQKVKSPKFIKLDLLQLSAEDLCFCLCQFIKEVRKPNGAPYASDTIYYLCLGVQLYLYENGRIDNLFCDPFYEKFTDTFNEICLSFCQLYNDSQYIITRVEEEHLWESKQLGAHSPLVLLNTLLFFNTKHFNLISVDDHLQLSFSHIMKHWKRNANAPNQRNVLLRFYPPSKGAWGKRKVYEQQECLENPLRCPVRLYEFFLSKCPESVKTRNDVFYLQPERSCVPDSPVWYSTSALERTQLEKMLNRMKMIKEISMAILGT